MAQHKELSRLDRYMTALPPEIPAVRRALLDRLAEYILQKHQANQVARLVFICTHNSRRSHFAQVWAQVTVHQLRISRVECYSGGTEATACNPRTVAALERAGLTVLNGEQAGSDNPNPVYQLAFADDAPPVWAFSKVYDQPPNPISGFAAVMTCSQADADCPFVAGAERRFTVTYEDPKLADDTPEEAETYDARCRQIASEMLYVFRQIA
ncbi:MAG: protein-tyrosine-phosphatase [Saprospiraceae bacterium]